MLQGEKDSNGTGPLVQKIAAEELSRAQQRFDTVVQPRRAIFDLPIKQLWESNELLYFLVWRDLKVRYKQAVIGAGWAVLKPLMLMLVFVFVFGKFIRVPTGDTPYSIVVYSGLLPWTFITTVISSSAASLLSNSSLLTKIYFPRILAPLSASLVALVDLLISLPILFGILLWFDMPITPRVLWLPLLFGMIFVLAFSIGLVMAALHVRYRDIGLLLPILLQVWMYATPIIYPIDLVPARYLPFYSLNPVVGLIQGIRWVLVDATQPSPFMIASSAVLTLVVLVGGLLFFQFAEDTFADVV